jgi:uncharacterized protein YggU (UPF0235/DUF167 family)
MWYQIQPSSISFFCKVKVNAKCNSVLGLSGGYLAISLKAQPINGAANADLLNLLADFFCLQGREINLLRGHKSRIKLIAIPNYMRLLALLATL